MFSKLFNFELLKERRGCKIGTPSLQSSRSQLILQNEQEETKSNMYVRQGDAFQRIAWKNILYAEGMQNYVKLHFKDKVLSIKR